MRWTDDHCHLGHLDLERNNIGRVGVQALLSAPGLSRLESLSLNFNPLDLDAITATAPAPVRYSEVSRQPSVRRDLAVLLSREVPARGVLDAIRGTAGPHLVAAEIFDRYEGTGVPEGRVSVAFRLVFQRPDRTLLDTEVARATERVVRMLADRFGGELRQGAGEANQLGG